ncbi:MAG: YciI family protein, partial [Mesorhizobium sp.]
MFYAILAYHIEDTVQSWTPDEDAALMKDLLEVNDRLTRDGKLGPAARLGATAQAVTLRGPGDGMVID